jgi:hypothetical protein
LIPGDWYLRFFLAIFSFSYEITKLIMFSLIYSHVFLILQSQLNISIILV